MKILNFYEFAALPEGAIYSNWEPHVARDLCIKGETLNSSEDGRACDFFYRSLLPEWDWQNEKVEIQELWSRWGEYDDTVLFAVYDAEDVAMVKGLMPG